MPELAPAVGVAEKFRREENPDRPSDRFKDAFELVFVVIMYPWRVGDE